MTTVAFYARILGFFTAITTLIYLTLVSFRVI